MGATIPQILNAAGSLYAVLPSAAAANKGPAINAAGTAWEMRDMSDASLLTSGTIPAGRLPAADGSNQGALSSSHYTLLAGATSAITASTLVQRDGSSIINVAGVTGGATGNNVLTLRANSSASGNTTSNDAILAKVGNTALTAFKIRHDGLAAVGPTAGSAAFGGGGTFVVAATGGTDAAIKITTSGNSGYISLGNTGLLLSTDSGTVRVTRLQLIAGTAAANTAPLKMTSGTLLSVAEAGALEYDGTNLYFTPASGIRKTITWS